MSQLEDKVINYKELNNSLKYVKKYIDKFKSGEIDETELKKQINAIAEENGYVTKDKLSLETINDVNIDDTITGDFVALVKTDTGWTNENLEIQEYTKEELLEKIGLTTEDIDIITDILTDSSVVSTTKTWHSSAIYTELKNTKEECKDYTLEQISKIKNISYKIVNTTDEMTDTTLLYLMLNSETSKYDMYVKDSEDSEPTLIGNIDVNLTDYVLKTELNNYYTKDEMGITLSEYTKTSNLSNVATSGNYNDLIDIPTIIDDTNVSNDTTYSSNKINTEYVKITDIPTKVSDLTNDSGYIDKTVNNLVNYLLKSETYTQEEINEIISNINRLDSKIVDTLPTESISTTTIYLIKVGDTTNYTQHMYIDGAWADLGTTQIDLTDYYNKTQVDNKFATKEVVETHTSNTDIHVTTSEKTLISKIPSDGKLCATSVEDVSLTGITCTLPEEITIPDGYATTRYIVKNGIASIHFTWYITSATKVTTWTKVATDLPIPAIEQRTFIFPETNITNGNIGISISTTGELKILLPSDISVGDWWKGTITYPVA